MVTRILLDPRRDLPTGLTGSSTITVEATPTGVREDGSVVVLPTKLSFTVNTAADVVQLAPPAASWAWRIVSRDAASNVILQQRTVRFPDVPSIAYADLTDVDPSSLKQTPSTSRQWDATFFQLIELIGALQDEVNGIVAGAPGAFNTFLELANQIGLDEATVSALQALVAGKANSADVLAKSLSLPVNTISTNATALIGARNSINASAGPVSVTMPVPTVVGQHMIIERADASSVPANTITITGTIRGDTTATVTLSAVGASFEGALYIAESLTSWAIAASIKPRAVLDATYSTKLQVRNPNDLGYDIVLLAGQSNMQGDSGGAVSPVLDVTSARIWTYGATGTYASQIVQASDPLQHRGSSPTGATVVGPGMEFARWYATTIPENRRVLLVPAAYDGTAILSGTPRWDPANTWPNDSTNLYNLAIAQAQAALAAAGANSRIVAVLWVQGESDAIAGTSGTAYQAAFESLIDGFRSRLGLPNLPFVIGSMTPEFIANNTAPTRAAINAVHLGTPSRKPYTVFVQGPSGLGRGDNLHYSPAGHRVQGRNLVGGLYAASANATPTNAVPASPPALPLPFLTNTAAPVLSGTAALGQVLTVSNGTWSATPDTYAYQWTRGGTSIAGATASTYTLTTDDSQQTIACTVSAAKAGYVTGTAYSNAVAFGGPNTDGFTRADSSSMGATESGAKPWVSVAGTWGIASNRAAHTNALAASIVAIDMFSADHYSQGQIAVGDNGTAIVARTADANNWLGLSINGAASVALYRCVGGAISVIPLATGALAGFVVNDTIKISLKGSLGTIYRNGTSVATFADSSVGTKVGLRADTASARFDNFASDLS